MERFVAFVAESGALAWLEATDWWVAYGPDTASGTPAGEPRVKDAEKLLLQSFPNIEEED